MLFKFVIYHTKRQRRGVNRKFKFFIKVGHRADVILVGVRDDDAFYLVFYLAHIVKVRDQDIHAVHALTRKTHADIDNDRARIGLKYRHISADLAQPAKRRDANPVIGRV